MVEANHIPSILWSDVMGTFLCQCGEPSDFEDCMLPAYHECPQCKRFYIVEFTVKETEKVLP